MGWHLTSVTTWDNGHILRFNRGGHGIIDVTLFDDGDVRLKVVMGNQNLRHPWRQRVADLASSAVMHWALTGSVRDFPEVPNL